MLAAGQGDRGLLWRCMSLIKDGLEGFFDYRGFRFIDQLQGFLLSQLNQSLG